MNNLTLEYIFLAFLGMFIHILIHILISIINLHKIQEINLVKIITIFKHEFQA